MIRVRLDHMLWAATVLASVAGFLRYSAQHPPLEPQVASGTYAVLRVQQPDGDSLTKAVAIITDGDLFRIHRGDQAPVTGFTAPPAPSAPRPQLALRGLVGGPPWEVLVDGIPGRQGTTVLRVGEEASGVTVTSVRRGTVVAKGYDTTWTLTLRPASSTPGPHD
ncbi:MAG: hypothetical protein H0X64_04815 [Gemmatimonadaceae bacterium]|nr:hypothetical protein [Gemmatimonadaceae bacterium]